MYGERVVLIGGKDLWRIKNLYAHCTFTMERYEKNKLSQITDQTGM